MSAVDLADRVRGSLLGLAVGDALGAPLEFMSRGAIKREYGMLRELVGGGVFGWRPGQGTDDSDLTKALLDAYLDGYAWISSESGSWPGWTQGRKT
jgi:ADP-ribosyl-[dinitrogen reductase] hydrolase